MEYVIMDAITDIYSGSTTKFKSTISQVYLECISKITGSKYLLFLVPGYTDLEMEEFFKDSADKPELDMVYGESYVVLTNGEKYVWSYDKDPNDGTILCSQFELQTKN